MTPYILLYVVPILYPYGKKKINFNFIHIKYSYFIYILPDNSEFTVSFTFYSFQQIPSRPRHHFNRTVYNSLMTTTNPMLFRCSTVFSAVSEIFLYVFINFVLYRANRQSPFFRQLFCRTTRIGIYTITLDLLLFLFIFFFKYSSNTFSGRHFSRPHIYYI